MASARFLQTLPLAIAHSQFLSAASLPTGWASFRTLCAVVEFELPPDMKRRPDSELVNKSVASAIEDRLRSLQLAIPVEYGRQCYPGKAGSAPYQLSLQFHATLASGANPDSPIVLALIMHSYFRDSRGPPHEYPTRILTCANDDARLSMCLVDHVVQYFDGTALKIIDGAQKLLTGDDTSAMSCSSDEYSSTSYRPRSAE